MDHVSASRGRAGRIRVTVNAFAVVSVSPEDVLDHKFMEALRALVEPLVEEEDNNVRREVCHEQNGERQRCED